MKPKLHLYYSHDVLVHLCMAKTSLLKPPVMVVSKTEPHLRKWLQVVNGGTANDYYGRQSPVVRQGVIVHFTIHHPLEQLPQPAYRTYTRYRFPPRELDNTFFLLQGWTICSMPDMTVLKVYHG